MKWPDWPTIWCCWRRAGSGPGADILAADPLDLPLAHGDSAAAVIAGTVLQSRATGFI
jgi:hypothetical protein